VEDLKKEGIVAQIEEVPQALFVLVKAEEVTFKYCR
jgi:hypothetical protein